MSILVIAEHNNQTLATSTLKTVSAALNLKAHLNANQSKDLSKNLSEINADNIDILVAGYNCAAVAEQASHISGINAVLCCDHPSLAHQLAENVTTLILSQAESYSHIITSASTTGKNLMPRVAALLDVNQISDITGIESEDIFYRPIYAGNAIAKVKSLDTKKVLTVRSSAFDATTLQEESAKVITLSCSTENCSTESFSTESLSTENQTVKHIEDKLSTSTRPELTSAPIIVSGGRGLKSADNFALLETLADKLGGAVGASRAAVDAGFVDNDLQVGQTGKIVAPDLYIAVGLSGAIQHLAGMKASKVIVAINHDPDAPIFQVADYGLVADLFEALPELSAKV